LNWKR